MSLRYALLALLTSQGMTGYEVSQRFSGSVAHVWHAPDSQIYPELRRMEAAGLLEVSLVADGGRGTKKRYDVTVAGLKELEDWLSQPAEHRRQRDPAYLKAAYLEFTSAESIKAQMQAHIDYYSEHLALLKRTRASLLDGTHPTLAARLEARPPADHARIVGWKVFAYDGLIAQAEQEIRWARRGLQLADELN